MGSPGGAAGRMGELSISQAQGFASPSLSSEEVDKLGESYGVYVSVSATRALFWLNSNSGNWG